MTIDPAHSSKIQGHPPEIVAPERKSKEAMPPARPPERGDKVDISREGRSLAAMNEAGTAPLPEARLAEIRALIESGHYERPELLSELADRLMDSGDL